MFLKLRKFIKKKQASSVAVAALIVSIFGILSRILGLLRDRVLSAHYGAGDILDVYYAAFRIPDFIFELLIVGSFSAAFIPVFTRLRVRDKYEESWQLAQDLLLLFTLSISFFAIFAVIFAPQLMHVVAPGFTEEKILLSTKFIKIMLISPIFLAASAIIGGILVSLKRFVLYASAPIFYNIGIIIGITVIVPYLNNPIGLAWGVVLGAFLHFSIHLIALSGTSWKFKLPTFYFYKNPNVKSVLHLMIPRVFGGASNQISLIFVTIFASGLASGSLVVFTFAQNIQSVILGLVGTSFALAVFPSLSIKYAKGDLEKFSILLDRTLRRILFYSVPMSVLFWILRVQIVRVIYGAGHFNWKATNITTQVLGILLISAFAQALIPLLARAFYAMGNTKTPVYVAILSQIINFLCIALFIKDYKINAIALAFTISTLFNAIVLFFVIYRKLDFVAIKQLINSLLYIIVASVGAGFITYAVRDFIGSKFLLEHVWEIILQLLLSGVSGVFMYLGLSALFDLQEFETIKKNIIIRIFGKPIVAGEEQHNTTGTGS